MDLYQVDAFTKNLFCGNSAAVCVMKDKFLPFPTLLNIAMENNLAETAFILKNAPGDYEIRWFTPEIEMDLCGHATLASSHVIFNHYEPNSTNEICLRSKFSGNLKILKKPNNDDQKVFCYKMFLPRREPEVCELPDNILVAMNGLNGAKPLKVLKHRDYFVVLEKEEDVRNICPNEGLLAKLDLGLGGICVTAVSSDANDCDFVSRYFNAGSCLIEDPVTGSSHCSLIPYWSKTLGKKELIAKQVSKRLGTLFCEDLDTDFVSVSGNAVTFFQAKVNID